MQKHLKRNLLIILVVTILSQSNLCCQELSDDEVLEIRVALSNCSIVQDENTLLVKKNTAYSNRLEIEKKVVEVHKEELERVESQNNKLWIGSVISGIITILALIF